MSVENDLVNKVIDWADDKGLLNPENAPKQSMKVMEELGETMSAILKGDESEIEDGIGDILVTVIILSMQMGYHPLNCLDVAYQVISKRKGTTVDGIFIKE